MQGQFWHLFLTQLFMIFHMVASVLLSIPWYHGMVAFSTIFLLVKSDLAFSLRSFVEKKNSASFYHDPRTSK